MSERPSRVRLPIHIQVALVLIALLILASCFSRQLNGAGWDFQAYFKAAGRILQGQSPYLYEKDFSYKYAPVIALPFTFFHLFSYEIARWVWAAFHAGVALACPYVLYKVLERDPHLGISKRVEDFSFGILVSFMGTFRFIDSEFHVSQIGLWITMLLLLGALCLSYAEHSPGLTRLGLVLLSFGALVKIHTIALFAVFLKWRSPKTYLSAGGILFLIALLPNPAWWLEWVEHMKRSTRDLPMDMSSVNLQGFYPLAVLHLGMDQFSYWPLLLAAPFGILAFWKLPRLSLQEIPSQPHVFLLTISVWTLLGFMASPLPWQYTYCIAWVLIPLSWVTATRFERRVLIGLALFLGLTPQGIIGKQVSMLIEQHQSIFAGMFIIWILLLRQTLRTSKLANSPV